MDTTNKLIQDQLNSLPPEIKETINRVPWKDRVRGIAKREGLSDEKAAALENETLFIIYGFLPPEEYGANIQRELSVNEEAAERIAKEVFDEVIIDIEKQYEAITTTPNLAAPTTPEKNLVPEVVKAPSSMPVQPQAQPTTSPMPKVVLPIQPVVIEKREPLVPVPKISTETLPEVVLGQTAHAVPRVEKNNEQLIVESKQPEPITFTDEPPKRPNLTLPKSDYVHGQDPYREPMQ